MNNCKGCRTVFAREKTETFRLLPIELLIPAVFLLEHQVDMYILDVYI